MTFEEYAQKHLGDAGYSFSAMELVRMGWNARGSYGSCSENPNNSDHIAGASKKVEQGAEPVVYWVLYDNTAEKKYIKKSLGDGSLAFFDTEAEARRVKSWHGKDVDYMRVEYYTQPQSAPTITPAMIEAGAKRLARWEDDSVWPDSWRSIDIAAAKQDAERVIRSALAVAGGEQ